MYSNWRITMQRAKLQSNHPTGSSARAYRKFNYGLCKKVQLQLSHPVCSSARVKYRKRQKFRGWKVLRFAGLIRYVGKSFAIFSITTFIIHGFPTATSVSTKVSRSSSEFSLKLSSAYTRKWTRVHKCAQISAFRDDHAVTGGEKLYSWDKTAGLLTASLLASSASYFLISWQKPSRFFATIVEYFLYISRCQLSAE